MPQKSYKSLYNKALLMLECFSARYEEEHTKEDWDELLEYLEDEDIEKYLEELKSGQD